MGGEWTPVIDLELQRGSWPSWPVALAQSCGLTLTSLAWPVLELLPLPLQGPLPHEMHQMLRGLELLLPEKR